MNNTKSKAVYEKSCVIIPGGVNSPVRAYRSVQLTPPVIANAAGSKITDIDGNEYIDYVGSWGPMILGHTQPDVVASITEAAQKGTSFGAPTENEYILSDMICKAIPSIEMLRLVNSGTEAAMSAIRLARGYTGREEILKFEGCYHGHSDGLLVKAGSGALTSGVPNSAGVPEDYVRHTMIASYNDCEEVREIFRQFGNNLAAVIVEPVAANMGVVLPEKSFLRTLRELSDQYGVLLIFDEVITGFRILYGGVQQKFGIIPDITILGKIIGGGMPVGAFGGRKDIMRKLAPEGPVYQAGTLSGNPIATAAGIATLKTIKNTPGFYSKLDRMGKLLEDAYLETAKLYNANISVNRIGSLMSVFFNDNCVVDYKIAVQSNLNTFRRYFSSMLERGIYLAPSQFEAMFLSYAHNEKDIEITKVAIEEVFLKLCYK